MKSTPGEGHGNEGLQDEGNGNEDGTEIPSFPRDDQSLETNVTRPIEGDNPRQEAADVLRESGISPRKHPKLFKEITSFRTLTKHISKVPKNLQTQVLKKHKAENKGRCATYLAKKIGIGRRAVFSPKKSKSTRKAVMESKKSHVLKFLKNSDNSTPLPGKRDSLKKGAVQRYTLNDTVANLYLRYKQENPNVKLGRASFANMRPSWMKPIQWATRRQCLCHIHQNACLKLKAIKQPSSPNVFIKMHDADSISALLNELPEGTINFSVWEKEDVVHEGTVIKKMRLKEHEVSKAKFCDLFMKEFENLREHIRRTTTQYVQLDQLKQKMDPLKEATCQIDYSENYLCSYQDEPSQVFYDKRQITLHPMVIHFRQQNGSLDHKSYIGMCDDKNHSAPTTLAFISKLITELKILLPDLEILHFISDSPASQYRNRSIVKLVSHSQVFFAGITTSWDYLESGHGKGPCDGIGGSLKKSADIAVKKGKIISGAKDMFNWAAETESAIKCIYIESNDIKDAERRLRNPTQVKGLSLIHSLRPFQGSIWMRETSCYGPCCSSEPKCAGWIDTGIPVTTDLTTENESLNEEEPPVTRSFGKQTVTEVTSHASDKDNNPPNMVEQNVALEDEEEIQSSVQGKQKYSIGDFVQANYEGKEYVGKILEYSAQEDDYFIDFMCKGRKNQYIWPKRKDQLWVVESNIKRVVTMKDGTLVSE
jgi:hypothetical protein